jgi:uncharacterized protein (DUF427 family)
MANTEIQITPVVGTAVIRAGGAVIGESRTAVWASAGGDASIYVPREDVAMVFLDATDNLSVDPVLGAIRTFNIVTKSTTLKNAAWSVESPNAAAAALKDLLAFDPEQAVVEIL